MTLDAGAPERTDFDLTLPLETSELWLSEPLIDETDDNSERTVFVNLKDPPTD